MLIKCLHGPLGDQFCTMVFKGRGFYKTWIWWFKLQPMLCKPPCPLTHHILHFSYHLDRISSSINKCWLIWIISNNFVSKKLRKTTTRNKSQEHIYPVDDLVLLLLLNYEWHARCKLQSHTNAFWNSTVSIRHGHIDKIVSMRHIQTYMSEVKQMLLIHCQQDKKTFTSTYLLIFFTVHKIMGMSLVAYFFFSMLLSISFYFYFYFYFLLFKIVFSSRTLIIVSQLTLEVT